MTKSAKPADVEPTIRSLRWIGRDHTGRELVVYQLTEAGARTMLAKSSLLAEDFTLRNMGHVDDQGRLHIVDDQTSVVDLRITS